MEEKSHMERGQSWLLMPAILKKLLRAERRSMAAWVGETHARIKP